MSQWHQRALLGIILALLLVKMPADAVDIFKVSKFGDGVQIWFEAEAFDAREPEGPQYFPIAGEEGGTPAPPKGAFGKTVTRTGGAGGRLIYSFDISTTDGGKKGLWYFWARLVNPSNQSDYLLVKGANKKIPDKAPFPGGDQVPPFVNALDRIFEANVAGWGWDGGGREGHKKELQNGENWMYIYHRQGNTSRFMDVFVWTDSSQYRPTDDDYEKAKERTAKSVEAVGKLAEVWGNIKSKR